MKNVISGVCIILDVIILVSIGSMAIECYRFESRKAYKDAYEKAYVESYVKYFEAAYREAYQKAIEKNEPREIAHNVTCYEYRNGEIIRVEKVIYEEVS